MASSDRPDHDARYHRLFSHSGVVAQLLTEFVGAPWLADLDLDRMERLNAKFHAETSQRREGDMIWRIPRRDGGDSYLLLLLEFQSSSETYMALRVLTYAALLWQLLIGERRLLPDGKLPPLFPVVIYNGDGRWRAPLALRALVGLPEASPLWHWQPEMRYYLVEVSAFSEADLKGRDGLPALWFRLENTRDPAEAVLIADALLAWLSRHPGYTAARTVFIELLSAMVAPLGTDIRVPEDLLGVRNMLLTRWEQWVKEARQEAQRLGLQEGRQDGLQQGLQEGLQQGLQVGRQEGLQQGLQVGRQEGLQQGLQVGRQEGLQQGLQVGRQEGLQQGRQEGLQQARREALQDGRQEGEAALLMRQLERRFGALPDWMKERVLRAETALLEEWGLKLLDAGSLDEVLGERSP